MQAPPNRPTPSPTDIRKEMLRNGDSFKKVHLEKAMAAESESDHKKDHMHIILVVDDEPIITQTLVQILNSLDRRFLAIGSNDVEKALALVRGIRPDLVLLDAIMPGALGLSHAIEMRDRCGCAVLMMSGHTETADLLEEVKRAGHKPFEILAKPIHPLELAQKIEEVLRYSTQ